MGIGGCEITATNHAAHVTGAIHVGVEHIGIGQCAAAAGCGTDQPAHIRAADDRTGGAHRVNNHIIQGQGTVRVADQTAHVIVSNNGGA